MTGLLSIAGATIAMASLSTAPVQIEGAVKNPGAVKCATTLKSTIAQAGGFAPNADLRAIEVRSANGESKKWDLYALGVVPTVKPGDSVIVPTLDMKSVVLVEGSVANRAPIAYREGMTLAEALAASKPLNKKSVDRVVVTRVANGQNRATIYKAKDLERSGGTIRLEPGDRVMVPHANNVQTSDRQLLTILLVALVIIVIAD